MAMAHATQSILLCCYCGWTIYWPCPLTRTILPLNGKLTGYLEDLFVVEEYRGKGVADLLIEDLKRLAKDRNWLFIRWKTRENNYRAKAFHDKIARKTIWHTYQLDINKAK